MAATRVYLEEGRTSTFAVALDWPGWCRRGKSPDLALEALDGYRDRYGAVVALGFTPGRYEVLGTLPGNGATDFGVPSRIGPWDEEPLAAPRRRRQVEILERSWAYFDAVVGGAPSELRRGPRGGGRDRDEVLGHVREAERTYCAKVGVRVPPDTPWVEQRVALEQRLLQPSRDAKWPVSYAIRRIAWHVLDHAWEIEDKST